MRPLDGSCLKLDKELAAKGEGRKGKGGKGKGKADKSWDYAGVDPEEEQPTAVSPSTQTAEEEWWMGAT